MTPARLSQGLVMLACLALAACAPRAALPEPAAPEAPPQAERTPALVPTATGLIPGPPPRVTATAAPAALPALQEARRLTLEWPPVLRAGDSDVVRLRLEVDDGGGLTPTAEFAGHTVRGETLFIPNLYDTHNVVAEARLDLAGMVVSPPDLVGEPLRPGQPVTFYWSVRPEKAGSYRGVVWLYLRFVPLDGSPESRRAVSAQVIDVEVVSLFGLKAGPARTLGLAGSFLGAVLGVPFLEDLLRWLWYKRKRQEFVK
jgi:hypothetical protein